MGYRAANDWTIQVKKFMVFMGATILRDRTHRRSRITDGADFVHHTRQLLRRISRRTPQRIVNAHPPDQRAQFPIDLRSASKRAGFPPPVPTEFASMPTYESLGTDDRDGPEAR